MASAELVLFYPSGIAMDRLGRTPVSVACVGTMAAGFGVLACAHGLPSYVVGAVLVGLGSGIGAGIIKTLGGDLAPVGMRARYLGWWNALGNVGPMLVGLLVAGVVALTSPLGGFVALSLLGACGAGWTGFWLPKVYRRSRAKP